MAKKLKISLTIDEAATLHALIDSAIGSSDEDDFNDEMYPVRDRLRKEMDRYFGINLKQK